MKNILFMLAIITCILSFSCKEKKSERFKLRTGHVWTTDSLLANGVDASGPGELLELFKGDAKFEEDGTGTFGNYEGTWWFNTKETEINIDTDEIPIVIICDIVELTSSSLKITAVVPSLLNPLESNDIRMTFKAK